MYKGEKVQLHAYISKKGEETLKFLQKNRSISLGDIIETALFKLIESDFPNELERIELSVLKNSALEAAKVLSEKRQSLKEKGIAISEEEY